MASFDTHACARAIVSRGDLPDGVGDRSGPVARASAASFAGADVVEPRPAVAHRRAWRAGAATLSPSPKAPAASAPPPSAAGLTSPPSAAEAAEVLAEGVLRALRLCEQAARTLAELAQDERQKAGHSRLPKAETPALERHIVRAMDRIGLREGLVRRLVHDVATETLEGLAMFLETPAGHFGAARLAALTDEMRGVMDTWTGLARSHGPLPHPPNASRRAVLAPARAALPSLLPPALWVAVRAYRGLDDCLAGWLLYRLGAEGLGLARDYATGMREFDATVSLLQGWLQEACVKTAMLDEAVHLTAALSELKGLNATLSRHPDEIGARERRAELLADVLKEPSEALQDLHRLLQRAPSVKHYVGRALMYERLHQLERADRDIDAALALDPLRVDAHALRVIVALGRQDLAGAKAALVRARAVDDDDPEIVLAALRVDEAELTLALQRTPGDIDKRLARAVAWGSQGDYVRASRDCARVLLQDPTHERALANKELYDSLLALPRPSVHPAGPF
jgi:tetratricopeptide (TPR) repeat protein